MLAFCAFRRKSTDGVRFLRFERGKIHFPARRIWPKGVENLNHPWPKIGSCSTFRSVGEAGRAASRPHGLFPVAIIIGNWNRVFKAAFQAVPSITQNRNVPSLLSLLHIRNLCFEEGSMIRPHQQHRPKNIRTSLQSIERLKTLTRRRANLSRSETEAKNLHSF